MSRGSGEDGTKGTANGRAGSMGAAGGPAWTYPEEIRAKIERLWRRGKILGDLFGEVLFPLTLSLRRPSSSEMAERFGEVREWIRAIEAIPGTQILWEEINHRLLGKNRIPVAVVIPTPEAATGLIGRGREFRSARALCLSTRERFPELDPLLRTRPLLPLENAHDWPRILDVLDFFRKDRERSLSEISGKYLRQLEIPGVDTKFFESRRGLLSDLLDRVVCPEEGKEKAPRPPGARGFEARFGLRTKPVLVRFRVLDPALAISGLFDLSVSVEDFERLTLPVSRTFVVENEINGLAFPDVVGGIVIFGLGYGLDRLFSVRLLRDSEIFYWGDLDTHGFAILDQFREGFPEARSFLMDRTTLLAHRALWGREPHPFRGDLSRLTEEERALFLDLREDRLGKGVRLEQERIGFSRVRGFLGDTLRSEG